MRWFEYVQFITFKRLTWAKLIKFRTTSISWEKDIFEAERLTFDEWCLWEDSCNKQFSRSEDTALWSILPHHHFLRCPFESVPRFIIRAVVRDAFCSWKCLQVLFFAPAAISGPIIPNQHLSPYLSLHNTFLPDIYSCSIAQYSFLGIYHSVIK